MKTNIKMTEAQQAAVNEIARNAFIAERFGKIKGDIVKANKPFVDKHEDHLEIKLYDAQGAVKDYGDITSKVTESSSTAINVNGLYWNCSQEDEHFWYDGTCQAKLELTHGSTVTKRNITFVNA